MQSAAGEEPAHRVQGVMDVQLEEEMIAHEARSWWWVFLLVGVLWLWIGIIVFRLDLTSITAVGFLIGGLLVVAALNEMMEASAAAGGWKVLHYGLAALFILGAIWGFARPINTVFALASVLGFILLMMGTFDILRAVSSRGVFDLWWLGLVTGTLFILLAIWVSQRFYPARIELILLWVGFMAIFRGVSQIGTAFAIRRVGKQLAAA
jgi:uncharacterized membrane protein HdeD (DUF308 family)